VSSQHALCTSSHSNPSRRATCVHVSRSRLSARCATSRSRALGSDKKAAYSRARTPAPIYYVRIKLYNTRPCVAQKCCFASVLARPFLYTSIPAQRPAKQISATASAWNVRKYFRTFVTLKKLFLRVVLSSPSQKAFNDSGVGKFSRLRFKDLSGWRSRNL
jgi:hypothetical protein